jgi:hypothetical protein
MKPYLLEQGFTNVTVIDIAPTLVKILSKNSLTIPAYRFGDFFNQSEYDLIEQTFSALYHR